MRRLMRFKGRRDINWGRVYHHGAHARLAEFEPRREQKRETSADSATRFAS